MNCHKCGHPADRHERWEDSEMRMEYGCQDCACSWMTAEIKLDAWKAEALAARELLATMKGRVMFRYPTVEEEVDKLYKKYLAAKVVDIPMFPQ